ncbi:MAG: hypothetical protein R3C58_09145 [Parvularculaceae bacterium]
MSVIVDVENKARINAFLIGVLKGIACAALVIAVSDRKIVVTPIAAGVTLFLGIFTEYFWYYRPNMKRHREMYLREGSAYAADLAEAVSNLGLIRMVQSWWFINRFKSKWGC